MNRRKPPQGFLVVPRKTRAAAVLRRLVSRNPHTPYTRVGARGRPSEWSSRRFLAGRKQLHTRLAPAAAFFQPGVARPTVALSRAMADVRRTAVTYAERDLRVTLVTPAEPLRTRRGRKSARMRICVAPPSQAHRRIPPADDEAPCRRLDDAAGRVAPKPFDQGGDLVALRRRGRPSIWRLPG
jgi:hypothetical protein